MNVSSLRAYAKQSRKTKPQEFINVARLGCSPIKTKPQEFINSAKGSSFPIKAFTLAETLITLAIIGVIAALTIPNLMKNYERAKLEAQFKHAYKILSAAIEKSYIDNNYSFVPSNVTSPEKTLDYLADNYLGGKTKTSYTTWGPKQFKHYSDNSVVPNGCPQTEGFLKNGMALVIRNQCSVYPFQIEPGLYITSLIVDVNGQEKGPNRWGYDVWAFNIDKENHKLAPDGAVKETLNTHGHNTPYKCGSQGSAKFNEDYGCAYYAIINRCPEDESQTYWQCLKF